VLGDHAARVVAPLASAPPKAAATAIFGGRLGLWLKAVNCIGMPVDPDDRKDDDRRRFAGLAAEAHNAPIVRKFYYRAHQPLPPPASVFVAMCASGISAD
jgi:hypothetical protein